MSVWLSVAVPVPGTDLLTYRLPDGSDADPQPGCRVIVPVRGRTITGILVDRPESPGFAPDRVKPASRVLDTEPIIGPEQIALGRWMADTYLCSLGEALSVMVPSGRRESEPPSIGLPEDERPARVILTAEQSAAVTAIRAEPDQFHYLYGVTGSGKTEVYLELAERALAEDRGVIILVPEIALSSQLSASLAGRFGDLVVVAHSRLTPSQRLAAWRRLRKGDARVVVGPRSAVFAPLLRPGLIVIDEEHESAYKSGQAPRYHARQIAFRRAREEGATLVMGSATPSLEAWSLMERNVIRRHVLPTRVAGGAPPEIEVVDLRGQPGTISERLAEEIDRSLQQGRQSLLFLNRRGFATLFHCRSCGYEHHCPNCSVALTYHQSSGRLQCHYCGYRGSAPEACPQCGSLDTAFSGFGTEQVEQEVNSRFPGAAVARLDADAGRAAGATEQILADFREGRTQILLGTQMVAKGLNFPGLRLVGVIHADTALSLPDFRAAERTFSLLVQVAGRAGRYHPDGLVIVQTYRPEFPAVQAAVQSDIQGFYASELRTREALAFPPAMRLVRIVARARQADLARKDLLELSGRMREAGVVGPGRADLLGPVECGLAVINRQHRYQLLLRAQAIGPVLSRLGPVLRASRVRTGVYREIDVDPVQLI